MDGQSFEDMLKGSLAELEGEAAPEETPTPAEGSEEGAAMEPETETPEPEEEEEQEDEAEVVKNPEALLNAHRGLKDKYKARGEKLAALEAKLAEVEQGAGDPQPLLLPPTEAHPLSAVQNEADLKEAKDFWKAELDWCAQNPDGGVRKIGQEEREVDADWVTSRRKLAMDVITKHLDERKQFIGEFKTTMKESIGKYPFFAPNHALYQEFDSFATAALNRSPGLSQNAAWPAMVSRAFAMSLVEDGKYAVTKGEDGSMKFVPLRTGKPGSPVPRTLAKPAPKPSMAQKASTPPSRPGSQDAAFDEALEKGDPRSAISAWVKANHG